jgi:hypothetical protein
MDSPLACGSLRGNRATRFGRSAERQFLGRQRLEPRREVVAQHSPWTPVGSDAFGEAGRAWAGRADGFITAWRARIADETKTVDGVHECFPDATTNYRRRRPRTTTAHLAGRAGQPAATSPGSRTCTSSGLLGSAPARRCSPAWCSRASSRSSGTRLRPGGVVTRSAAGPAPDCGGTAFPRVGNFASAATPLMITKSHIDGAFPPGRWYETCVSPAPASRGEEASPREQVPLCASTAAAWEGPCRFAVGYSPEASGSP